MKENYRMVFDRLVCYLVGMGMFVCFFIFGFKFFDIVKINYWDINNNLIEKKVSII